MPRKRVKATRDFTKPACWASKCGRDGTVYRAHAWYCPTHAKEHEFPCSCVGGSRHFVTTDDGSKICGFCCGIKETT